MMHRLITLKTASRLGVVVALVLGSFALVSAPGPGFSPKEKAFYADEQTVAFVRPGLVIKILSAEIAQDGTIRARVRFTDPAGLALNREGVDTPGPIGASFIAGYIPQGQTQYTTYTTRVQTSPITRVSATQAGADTGGTWVKNADGEYTYTFGTKAPQGFNRSLVHTIGVYGNRNLSEFSLGINADDEVFHFVPATGQTAPAPRDVIRTETCNKCHDSLSAHGTGGRISMPICVMCHTPQTVDPDTGESQDMKYFIHKIHAGNQLPSVAAGKKYIIIGNSQSVHDFSGVAFPSPLNSCETCHESNRGATQHEQWLKAPSRLACGSCHDTVNFATGEGHVNLPQVSDNQCANCHTPQGEIEFDASIKGAHTQPKLSGMLGGLQYEIVDVADGVAGRRPTVSFRLKDKDGNPLQMSQMARVAVTLTGPTTDYRAFQSGYIQDDAIQAQGSGGVYHWTLSTAIPADAKGTWMIGLEGRRSETILPGTKKEQAVQYGAKNAMRYFSVDGSAMQPRKMSVSNEKCLACHTNLVLHGDNRVNDVAYCAACHNPVMTDAAVRPANQMPAESIDLALMIHRIHGGEHIKATSGKDYTIYGRGGTAHAYNHVTYPAPLQSCDMCHVNGGENVPVVEGRVAKTDPQGLLNPVQPATAACLACHTSTSAASHALANTTALGESCGTCHGPNADFSVGKVHAQ